MQFVKFINLRILAKVKVKKNFQIMCFFCQDISNLQKKLCGQKADQKTVNATL